MRSIYIDECHFVFTDFYLTGINYHLLEISRDAENQQKFLKTNERYKHPKDKTYSL